MCSSHIYKYHCVRTYVRNGTYVRTQWYLRSLGVHNLRRGKSTDKLGYADPPGDTPSQIA